MPRSAFQLFKEAKADATPAIFHAEDKATQAAFHQRARLERLDCLLSAEIDSVSDIETRATFLRLLTETLTHCKGSEGEKKTEAVKTLLPTLARAFKHANEPWEVSEEELLAFLENRDENALSFLFQAEASAKQALKAKHAAAAVERKTSSYKLKPLNPWEKKLSSALRGVIQAAAIEFATAANHLHEPLERMSSSLRSCIKDVDPSTEQEQREIDLTQAAIAAIEKQSLAFQSDEDLRDDFDEDLLHEVAIAALRALNFVEGFVNPPPPIVITEEHNAKKKVQRDARREKRIAAARAQQEKVKQKEEAKTESMKEVKTAANVSRQLLDEGSIAGIRSLGHVSYEVLPLSLEQWERALDVWILLVSLPQTYEVSRFSFGLFLRFLTDEKDQNQIVEDVIRGLISNCPHGSKVLGSRTSRHWFNCVADFITSTTGSKKKAKRMQKTDSGSGSDSSSDSEDSDDSDSDADSDEDSDTSESNSEASENIEEEEEGEEVEAEDVAPEEAPLGFAAEVKALTDDFKELGPTYVSWLNLDVNQRLVLLKWLADYSLQGKRVIEAADAVAKVHDSELAAFEKTIKELKDEFDKECRKLKQLKDEEEKSSKRKELTEKFEKKLQTTRHAFYQRFDRSDVEQRIRPLGSDRYGRMYWRLPMEKCIFVQTVSSTIEFPLVVPPKDEDEEEEEELLLSKKTRHSKLLDDEETPSKKRRTEAEAGVSVVSDAQYSVPQTVWGKIMISHLDSFIDSLEPRGRREAPLKNALEAWKSYLNVMPKPNTGEPQTGRIQTRSRLTNYGYTNDLRPL